MVSNKILALNVMVIVEECLVIPWSISAIWLFWVKKNQTPARRPIRAPRPAVPQPPDPRNSQSGAPTEYDLESQPPRDAGSVDNHSSPETAIDTNLIIPEAANSASQVKDGAG
ncbi:hypothetical protein GALMADRAFT_269455 [Galerina marginata CBS 339.88]|uniref:Uncharacterized protein n=1 Tax=Galerina marginata (strain CBS 339.88) TaxID=685588 RepID=A0A067SSJ3_GALM3|nr:hypothetical protein GALMADRAFT_269455 [Galerina marginata CBS 339.88]